MEAPGSAYKAINAKLAQDRLALDTEDVRLPPEARADLGMTRYQASALLTFKFNKQVIRNLVRNAQPAALGQAA